MLTSNGRGVDSIKTCFKTNINQQKQILAVQFMTITYAKSGESEFIGGQKYTSKLGNKKIQAIHFLFTMISISTENKARKS